MGNITRNDKVRRGKGEFDPREFGERLDTQLKSRSGTSFKTKKSFSPSTLTYGKGTCARYWYYAFNGADFVEKYDASSVANMELGTYGHEWLQALIEKTGMLVEAERKVSLGSPPVFGFVDLIIDWNGKNVVGEIKTTRSETFITRRHSMKPTPYHLLQLLLYMHILQLDEGFLIYLDKSNNDMVTIPVVMNERRRKEVDYTLDWMTEVYATKEDPTPPARCFDKESRICKDCPLSKMCWSDESEPGADIKPLKMPVV